jgi:antitoxin component YwqK of YwqJK toxin-antitoxin module
MKKYYQYELYLNLVNLVCIVLLSLSCSSSKNEDSDTIFLKGQAHWIASIGVDTIGEKNGVALSDSTHDIYMFHPNAKLHRYYNQKGELLNGQEITLFDNGAVNFIYTYKNSVRDGVKYSFYPSGNLKTWWTFKNDSLRGFHLEFYDKPFHRKAEYMASPSGKQDYIYRRLFDSATQKIIDVIDHREIELEVNPNLDPKLLQLPWEKEDWRKK